MQDIYVVVAVASLDDWKAHFGMSLLAAVQDFASHRFCNVASQRLGVLHRKSSMLPQARHQLVESAIEVGASHVLFIDSDQKFPSHTIWRLLEHKLPVVACNIPTKTFPSMPTARVRSIDCKSGTPLYTTPRTRDLQRVWRIGTGVMLIETKVFKDLPKPWFMIRYVEEVGEFVGEDWYLCELFERYGVPVYVDQLLSWQIGHIGDAEYTHDMCLGQLCVEGKDATRKGRAVPSEDNGERRESSTCLQGQQGS